jgi:hypothetical protein
MVKHFTHFEKVAVFSGSVRPKVLLMSDLSESFGIEEYAKQTEYVKSDSARILNVFRVRLSKVLKNKNSL